MPDTQRYTTIKRCTLISAIANTLLAVIKIFIGVTGHSQALIADGFHSFSDILSDGMVLIAAKLGKKCPDQEHPYGHHRIETLAVIIISLILLAIGFFIVYDVVMDFIHRTAITTPSFLVLIAALFSIATNEGLYRYLLRVGNRIHSNLVIGNAQHNRSDAYTSIIVLITATVSYVGWPFLDPIGAVIIALFILKMGLNLIYSSINELIDSGLDKKTIEEITTITQQTSGVDSLHQIRSRLHGGHAFLDIHLIVASDITVSEGHFIGEQVQLNLRKNIQVLSDITVHIDPEDDETCAKSIHLPSRQEIQAHLEQYSSNIPCYNLLRNMQLHYLNDTLQVDLYIALEALQTYTTTEIEQHFLQVMQSIDKLEGIKIYYIPNEA